MNIDITTTVIMAAIMTAIVAVMMNILTIANAAATTTATTTANANLPMPKDEIVQICKEILISLNLPDNFKHVLYAKDWKFKALMIAVLASNEELISNLLVCHKVDISIPTRDIDILWYAFSLINGTNINAQKIKICKLLLQHGASAQVCGPIGSIGNRTMLMDMAHRLSSVDNYELLIELWHILLQCGLDINATDSNGKTLLMYLCQTVSFYNKKIDIIQFLLEHGANVAITDNSEDSALMVVLQQQNSGTAIPPDTIFNNRNRLIKLFIENGADVNAVNNNNKGPLYLLYKNRIVVSPEVHLLLCTLQNISLPFNLNDLQYLCTLLYLQIPSQQEYLTQILVKFSNSSELYNTLIYSSSSYESGFKRIAQYGLQEHKDLVKIICCKVARMPLLVYIAAATATAATATATTAATTTAVKGKPSSKSRFFFYLMGKKNKQYWKMNILAHLVAEADS